MLVEPNLDVMLHDKRVGNKFALVTLTLKRARQLNDGAAILVNTTAKKPVSVALYEIYADKVKVCEGKPEGEEAPLTDEAPGVKQDPEAAALAATLSPVGEE